MLLVGGSSGSGKTMVAERLGLQCQIPWLQVTYRQQSKRLALTHTQAGRFRVSTRAKANVRRARRRGRVI